MIVSIVWPSGYLVSFETVNYPDRFGRKFEGIQQQGEFFLTLNFQEQQTKYLDKMSKTQPPKIVGKLL